MRNRREKFRGSRTHGRGKKAGRGAGKRGGKGNAGLHKHKYISTVKYHPDYFGRSGFKRHPSQIDVKTTINVGSLMEHLDAFVASGKAEKKGDKVEVNLQEIGIDKLLGTGKASAKVVVLVDEATERAITKIQEAGGEVQVLGEEAWEEAPAEDDSE